MTGAEPGLIGRDDELGRLRSLVHEAQRGRGGVAVVEGEAGIGKTRLVDALVATAVAEDAAAAVGHSDELSAHLPFAPLLEAFGCRRSSSDPRRAAIAEMAATGSTAAAAAFGGSRAPVAVIEGFVDLLEACAAERPLLLVVEDAHWADEGTLIALGSLSRRARELPAAVVVTTRPPPITAEGQQLLRVLARHGADTIRLAPLPPDDVVALCRDRLGAVPGPDLTAQLARVGGNPLYVRELLDAAVVDGLLTEEDGHVDLVGSSLPANFRVLVLNRVVTLGQETAECLRAAAVLGREFSLAELAALMQRPAVSLVHPLELARVAGLLGEAGPHLAFRHDLVRQAIYDDLPQDVRAALHQAALTALVDAGAPAERVAPHALAVGGASSARWLQQAAADVVASAPSSAVALCTAALDLLGAEADADARLQLAEALLAAGRAQEAGEVASAVEVDGVDDGVRARAARIRFQALVGASRFVEAGDAAREGARRAEPGTEEHAWCLAMSAGLANMLGDASRAEADATAALASAAAGGFDRVRWTALAFLGWAVHPTAGRNEALRLIDEAALLADDNDGLPHAYRGLALLDLDRFDEAETACRRAKAVHEHDGQLFLMGIATTALVGRFVHEGRWDDAVAEAEGFLSLSDEYGLHLGLVICHAVLGIVAAQRGDRAAAARSIAAADEVLAASGPQVGMDMLSHARGSLFEADGDDAAACAAYGAGWDIGTAFRSLGVGPERLHGPQVVRLACRLGDDALARRVCDVVEQAPDDDVAGMTAAKRLVRGLVEHDADALADAVALYRQSPRPLDHGRACVDAALAAAASDDAARARAFATEAAGVFEGLGAHAVLDRALADLRDAGVRLGSTGSRKRPKTGWESLTPAELRVAELVADARTNGDIARHLFISRHTVETHVRHIYRKLGLSTRTELAIAAAAQFAR